LGSQEKLDEFLATPEKFVPPSAPNQLPPPDQLPIRRHKEALKSLFPKQVELKGYCPVTYADGKLRCEAIIEANPEYLAEYTGRIYMFDTEEKLQKFMRLPAKYADLKLPNKLPPKKQPMSLITLPLLGYLEQGVAHCIVKSLTAAGCAKPKLPFVSVRRSALLYVACHLKAFNPKSSAYSREKYMDQLRHYDKDCALIVYLGNNMTKRFKEPWLRPLDFDNKMSAFLSKQPIK